MRHGVPTEPAWSCLVTRWPPVGGRSVRVFASTSYDGDGRHGKGAQSPEPAECQSGQLVGWPEVDEHFSRLGACRQVDLAYGTQRRRRRPAGRRTPAARTRRGEVEGDSDDSSRAFELMGEHAWRRSMLRSSLKHGTTTDRSMEVTSIPVLSPCDRSPQCAPDVNRGRS